MKSNAKKLFQKPQYKFLPRSQYHNQDFQNADLYNQEFYPLTNNQHLEKLKDQKGLQIELCFEINTLDISPNQQIIAYGDDLGQLTIMNLINKEIEKQIELDSSIQYCKFSDDSNLIYYSDYEGCLYCFDIQKDFEQIFKDWLYCYRIRYIKPINNQQVITYSQDGNIMITEIQKKRQILEIKNAHIGQINALEYDSKTQVFISCSSDCSIKFYYIDGKVLIDKLDAHQVSIQQIQLKSNNYLMSSSKFELKQWKIDYDSQSLRLLRKFSEKVEFCFFQFINDEQLLIKIFQNYLLILSADYRVLKKQYHNIPHICFSICKEPISMRHLFVTRKGISGYEKNFVIYIMQ